VRDLRRADVGIGQHGLGGLDVGVGDLQRTTARSAEASSSGKTCLGPRLDRCTAD
jgi:hypothetical protein